MFLVTLVDLFIKAVKMRTKLHFVMTMSLCMHGLISGEQVTAKMKQVQSNSQRKII